MKPRISLVVLTCNQRDFTLRCLRSLGDFISRSDCELILVDNGSSDGTCEAVQDEFPEVTILRQAHNLGVAAGRNVGLRAATGKHLMILDNDTVADSETIFQLSLYLDAHPEVGLVAPRLTSPDGEIQSSFRPFPGLLAKVSNVLRGKRKSSVAAVVPDAEIEPFYVLGAAQMFPREVYIASGGLDENIFYGPEDADFCMAVRAQGKKVVYLPTLRIIHDWQRATTSNLLSKGARIHMGALWYFYRKHHRWL